MALKYPPRPGTLWMCDFDTGFKPPEMVKKRPVVVISPRPNRRTGLCIIVPLSTVVPDPVEAFHHKMDARSLPVELGHKETWAKCDMVYTVSLDRLSPVTKRGTGRTAEQRRPVTLQVGDEDLQAIRDCVVAALGLDCRRLVVENT